MSKNPPDNNLNNNTLCSAPRELHGSKFYGYILGALGMILPIAIFNAYSFQYYVYTVGLNSILTTIGIFIGLLFYAVGGPIFGVLSDNKRPTQRGKRRLFFLYGIPITAIAAVLNWTPPLCPKGNDMYWPTAIYFWIIAAALNLGIVIMFSPYQAMIPEQCQTEENRIKVASFQGLLNIIGAIISILLPMILQSQLEDPKNAKWWQPSGKYLTERMPFIGISFAIIMIITVLLAYRSIDESFFLNYKNQEIAKKGIQETFQQMFKPATNPKYKRFLGQVIFLSMGTRILMVVILPCMTYVLELLGIQYIIFMLLILPFAFMGFIFWTKLIKKKGLVGSFSLSILIMAIMLMTTIIFLLDMTFWPRIIIAFFIVGFALMCMVSGFIFPTPLISAIVDEVAVNNISIEEKEKAISQISGAYFGLNSFMLNIASGFANILLGFLFIGENAENPVFIVLSFPVAAILTIIAWICVRGIKLKKIIKEIN